VIVWSKPKKLLFTGTTKSGKGKGDKVNKALAKYLPMLDDSELPSDKDDLKKFNSSRKDWDDCFKNLNSSMLKRVSLMYSEVVSLNNSWDDHKTMKQFKALYGGSVRSYKLPDDLQGDKNIRNRELKAFIEQESYWKPHVDALRKKRFQFPKEEPLKLSVVDKNLPIPPLLDDDQKEPQGENENEEDYDEEEDHQDEKEEKTFFNCDVVVEIFKKFLKEVPVKKLNDFYEALVRRLVEEKGFDEKNARGYIFTIFRVMVENKVLSHLNANGKERKFYKNLSVTDSISYVELPTFRSICFETTGIEVDLTDAITVV